MRVGVNTGEVLVGALRAGGDYTAMGDVVNTASRLQTAAEPGEVLVGAGHLRRHPPGHRATRRSSRSTSRAARSSCRPGGPSTPCCRPGYRPERNRAALVGREAELGLLRHSVDNAVAQRAGRAAARARRGRRGQVPPGRGAGRARRVRARRARARGPLRALRRGQRVVAGGRRAPPRLRHPLQRPGRPTPSSWPRDRGAHRARRGAPRRPRSTASTRACSTSWATSRELRGIDPARAREEATDAVGHLRRAVLAPAARSWSCCPTCTGPTTSCSSWSTRCSSGSASRRFVVLATARQAIEERWHPPHGRHNLVVLTLDPLTADAVGRAARRAGRRRARRRSWPRRCSTAAAATRSSSRSWSPCSATPAWSAPTARPARRLASCPTRCAGWWRPASTA